MIKPLPPIVIRIIFFLVLYCIFFYWTIPIILHNPLNIKNITFKDYDDGENFTTNIVFHYADNTTTESNYNVVKLTFLLAIFSVIFSTFFLYVRSKNKNDIKERYGQILYKIAEQKNNRVGIIFFKAGKAQDTMFFDNIEKAMEHIKDIGAVEKL